jgi:hypothetical protein
MPHKRASTRAFVELSVQSDTGGAGTPTVRLSRGLNASAGSWDEDDPEVTLVVELCEFLHKGTEIRFYLEGMRTSELDGFIEALQQVVATARAARLLPPALTEQELIRRMGVALSHT